MTTAQVLKGYESTPVGTAIEIWSAVNGAGDTSFTVTPTNIKQVLFATVMPVNAAAAASAADSPYVSGVLGATVAVVGVNSGEYVVKIEGKLA